MSTDPGLPAAADGIDLLLVLSMAHTPSDLVAALNWYKIWAGDPSFRDMSQRAGHALAHSTMWKALNTDIMPRLSTVRAIVVGCGGSEEDLQQFVSAWRRIRLDTSSARPGARWIPGPWPPAEQLPG